MEVVLWCFLLVDWWLEKFLEISIGKIVLEIHIYLWNGIRIMNLHGKFVEIILHGRVGCLVFSLLYPDRFDQNSVTNQSCQIIRVCECYFYWKYCVAYNVIIQQVTNQIVLHYVTWLVQICWHSLSLLVLLLSVIVVILFIFKLKSNIIFQSDNFGLWSLSVCITYEFVVIKCKVVLVAVVLCLEKQKKGKRAKTVSKFNS